MIFENLLQLKLSATINVSHGFISFFFLTTFLNSGVNRDPKQIEKEVVQLVREKIGPVAAFKTAVEVKRLPKTRSGKILRSTMVKVANSETFKVPATIDDKAILDEIHAALSHYGYAKTKNF